MSNVSKGKINAPSKKIQKKGGSVRGVVHPSTSALVSDNGITAGGSINGATNSGAVGLPKPTQSVTSLKKGHNPSKKGSRRQNKYRHKRSGNKTLAASPLCSVASTCPPGEEDDWESEPMDVKPADGVQMSNEIQPYGPEDIQSFALQDLPVYQVNTTLLPVTEGYLPARHHPQPVQWSFSSIPTEPDQFMDADE